MSVKKCLVAGPHTLELTRTASREDPFVPVGCRVSRAWVLIGNSMLFTTHLVHHPRLVIERPLPPST
jgi:hypothetical protein